MLAGLGSKSKFESIFSSFRRYTRRIFIRCVTTEVMLLHPVLPCECVPNPHRLPYILNSPSAMNEVGVFMLTFSVEKLQMPKSMTSWQQSDPPFVSEKLNSSSWGKSLEDRAFITNTEHLDFAHDWHTVYRDVVPQILAGSTSLRVEDKSILLEMGAQLISTLSICRAFRGGSLSTTPSIQFHSHPLLWLTWHNKCSFPTFLMRGRQRETLWVSFLIGHFFIDLGCLEEGFRESHISQTGFTTSTL